MLKIKDNVDLKELEKYGFKKHKRDNEGVLVSKWVRDFCYGDDMSDKYHLDFYPLIEIIPNPKGDRILYFHLHYDYYRYKLCDLLYDLIQAGLVEKV